MWKKGALICLSLLLLAASNLHLCCRVSVGGRELEGVYSLQAVDRAMTLAANTAEEILAGPAVIPEAERRYTLSFLPPDGDEAALTDAALRAVTGVRVLDAAYVNGTRLGAVEDGEELSRRLERFITGQQPMAAVSGSISGRLEIRKEYGRSGSAVNYDDMLLLVTGMAPVIYLDADGKLA